MIVFTALMFAAALVQADSRFVGVNIVGPEHDPVALRDYALHMRIFAYLRSVFPLVPSSLHAGELTLGLVPPRELRFHIDQALTVAGARRIGHGIDIAFEPRSSQLLKLMARERIAIEVCLTSNADILGVKGRDHPIAMYRAAGVPVVLGTDDEGLSRSDMTNEYVRAVREQGLGFRDLVTVARNSLEYSFLPGASLWKTAVGGVRLDACAVLRAERGSACAAFLASSPKAAQQFTYEQALAVFVATHQE